MLADTIAVLESGAGVVVVATGMAALDLVLGLMGPDDRVIAPHYCHGGTYRLLAARQAKRQLDVAFVDQTDEKALELFPLAESLIERRQSMRFHPEPIRAVGQRAAPQASECRFVLTCLDTLSRVRAAPAWAAMSRAIKNSARVSD